MVTPVAGTIGGCLRTHAERDPARVFAHVYAGADQTVLCYGDLWQRSLDHAAHYRAAGVVAGDIVIVMLKGGIELYPAFLGAVLLGAVPSFMPYPTPKQDAALFWAGHRTLFARVRPRLVLSYGEIVHSLAATLPPESLIVLVSDVVAGAGTPPEREASPDETAFLQHSSGTTGHKKGVMLTHRAVMAQVESYARVIDLTSDATIATWLPLYHDMGLIACFILPLVLGATVCQLDPIEWVAAPMRLIELIERHRASHAWMPNFAFDHLAFAARRDRRRFDLSSLTAIINCSEPCKPASMANLVEALAPLGLGVNMPQVCYAMAETVFAVTQSPPGRPIRTLAASKAALAADCFEASVDEADTVRLASCGVPVDAITVGIVAPDGTAAADGAIGEIRIIGASLYDGYYLLPEITAEKYRDGWHHSGDLGFIHDGELYVTGRKDDLIIVRGRNFYAHDLEAVVNAVPGVKPGRCVIFTAENERAATTEAICLVELLPGVDAAAVRKAIKSDVEIVSGLMLGRVIALPLATLVKTTSGKISRDTNRRRYIEGSFKAIDA